jgi:hypothetical protein
MIKDSIMKLRLVGTGLLAVGLVLMTIDLVGKQDWSLDQRQREHQLASSTSGKVYAAEAYPEKRSILAAAHTYVRKNSVPEARFKLLLIKRTQKWAFVRVIPVGSFTTDEAGLIMEKTNRGWVGRAIGTDLSDWQKRLPELFR